MKPDRPLTSRYTDVLTDQSDEAMHHLVRELDTAYTAPTRPAGLSWTSLSMMRARPLERLPRPERHVMRLQPMRRRKIAFLACAAIAMLSLIGTLLAFLPLLLSSNKAQAAGWDALVGYGAGTTGGAGGSSGTVTTLSALANAVSGSAPKVVYISGTISGDADVAVGSNTTIQGQGSSAALVGISLDLDGVSNVIIRNLSLSYVLASDTSGDAIHIINGTTHVWIDHNNLFDDLNHGKDYYDGLLDITRRSDYITVSWNRFHNHYKVSLVGHSDSYPDDTGYLHVTYHHNWFYSVNSRLPSVRFGTAHVYNNYYQNVSDSAIHSRMGAQMLIENNVFSNVPVAITTTGDSAKDGFANARGNDYGGAKVDITQVGTFTQAPYSYTLDPVSAVVSEVSAYSGVGIIDGLATATPTTAATSAPTATATTATGATPTATTATGATPTATATPAPTPAADPLCQAESATLSHATVTSSASGYTGSGYVTFSGPGGWIEWKVAVSSAGKYSLVFRYANATANNLPASVSLNGVVVKANLTFKATGGASSWSVTQTSHNLPAGTITIRLTAGAAGGSAIDYLDIINADQSS